MRIISREEARLEPARRGIDEAPILRSHLYLHHSVTKSSDDVLSDWRAVQDAAFGRGFKDISYTFGVHITGAALEGRSPAVEGAHTEGFNRTGHAIVLIGNYENLEPTTEQIETVRWLRWWMTQIGLLIPTHSFRPHNLVQRTAFL